MIAEPDFLERLAATEGLAENLTRVTRRTAIAAWPEP